MKLEADKAADSWLAFWFRPEPVYALGMVRIAFGVMVLGWGLSFLPDLDVFFTSHGMLARPATGAFEWGLFQHTGTYRTVLIGWLVLMLAAIALTVGWHSRAAALVVFVLVLSFQYRNPLIFNSGDALIRVQALVIALAPSGAALSLDERRRTGSFWSSQTRAPWPLRLLQIQLTVVYVATFAARMSGETWPGGTALSYALRLDDMRILPVPHMISESPLLMNVGTWAVLAGELLIGILIWNRRCRPIAAILGTALHVAIMVTIAVGFFSPAMLLLYLAFVPADTAKRWAQRHFGVPGRVEQD